jgi:hypothetical protein
MLETLRKYDQKEAERILSSLTSELLPNPEIAIRAELGIDPDVHSKVWNEIRTRVKVDPSDASPQSRGRIFEFLFTEMQNIALPPSAMNATKSRLSRSDELRPDLYDVKFSPTFEVARAHGVRPNHVQEALRNADDVEHLSVLDGEVLLSFFLRILDIGGRDPFALLVLGIRSGHGLNVSTALRIYKSDIDYSGAQRPSDFLKLLVGKYGFSITVGNITSKLIIDQTTTILAPLDPDTVVKVDALEGADIYSNILFQTRALHNSYGVAIAFALDQAKYAADLRKHGVHVSNQDFTKPLLFRR